MRSTRYVLVLAAILACFCSMARATGGTPLRVLFVGNSLTYVGNLPAVLESLASSNGKPLKADMIVKGGATLTQWLDSGAVQKALQAGHYDYVVLQERGNDFACGFGPQVCSDSLNALHALAKIVRDRRAKPILMGTYQIGHDASESLVSAESKAAHADDMPYVAVSGRLNLGRERAPYDNWFAKAGHPGHALVLLESVLLYEQLYATPPQAKAFEVRAPMFVPGSKFAPPDPVSRPLPPEVPLAGGYDYPRDEVANAIALTGSH
jgi:hypothetical protein